MMMVMMLVVVVVMMVMVVMMVVELALQISTLKTPFSANTRPAGPILCEMLVGN